MADLFSIFYMTTCFIIFLFLLQAIWYRASTIDGRSGPDAQSAAVEKDPYQYIEPLIDFDWSKASPIRNAPLKPKFHLTMGMSLEAITLSELIAMDNTYVERMQIRQSLMSMHPDATLQCNTSCESAVFELHDWIFGTYLPSRFPRTYKQTTLGLLNIATHEIIPKHPATAIEALRALGRHVDTEFLLLLPSSSATDGSPLYHLEAFVNCFPSGFSTQSLLGLPLSQIHAPVPGYAAKLEKSMDRYFARLPCGRAVKRSNWAITTNDGALFAEDGSHNYGDEDVAEQQRAIHVDSCRLRSERQTLFRLPVTRALVFSFKTYQYRLEDVKRDGYAEDLAQAVEGVPLGSVPEMDFYKRGPVWREKVVEYLRS